MTRRQGWGFWIGNSNAKRRRLATRGLRIERLERRALLAATDMAAIGGRVFRDTTGDGYDAGEEVASAMVRLYEDDGDATFDASDTLLETVLTDSEGRYRFDDLTEGTYFVEQPSQSVGNVSLAQAISEAITFDATDVMGVLGSTVDSFNDTQQDVEAVSGVNATDADAASVPGALGNERDLFVQLDSGTGSVRLRVLPFGVTPVLQFDNSAGVVGQRTATWDGPDGDGATLDPTGLGGVDLTDGGASEAFSLTIGADDPNGLVAIRVFSDGLNWSVANVAIPDTGGTATSTVVVDYSAFSIGGGNGADFTSVGAVQLEIEGVASVNGQVESFEALGPTVETSNFDNFVPADLSLTKTVNDDFPQIGQNITFTITVTNSGPNPATGVEVLDPLPSGVGLTFVNATASQGSYATGSGLWTVGSLAAGATASLQLTASVDTLSVKVNSAEISASDQADPDSVPGNDAGGEDDQASVSVTPESADLSLTKTVDNAFPQVGGEIEFTLTLTNSGPSVATNVQVRDLLPPGLTFVSSNAQQGDYNNSSGIWNVGTVGVGDSTTLEITAAVVTAGSKFNEAEVVAEDQFDPDSTPDNDAGAEDDQASATVAPMAVDLSLAKSVDDNTPEVDQNVTFTVTLSNAGPDTATNIVVRDPLPAGLSFVASTPSQGSYDAVSGLWNAGDLADDDSATLQITARVTQGVALTNTAQVQSVDQFDVDSTPGNSAAGEDDQASIQVAPLVADLSVRKSVDNPTPARGSDITFTVTVMNSGPVGATGVVINDPLPVGLEFVSANASQGAFDIATGDWNVGALPNGGAATLVIVATVVSGGRKTNVSQVSEADQFDPDSTPGDSVDSQDDQASVLVTPRRSLSKRLFLAR